jgi:hypothetical protein
MELNLHKPTMDLYKHQMGSLVTNFGIFEYEIVMAFSKFLCLEPGILLSMLASEKFNTILVMVKSTVTFRLRRDKGKLKEFNTL